MVLIYFSPKKSCLVLVDFLPQNLFLVFVIREVRMGCYCSVYTIFSGKTMLCTLQIMLFCSPFRGIVLVCNSLEGLATVICVSLSTGEGNVWSDVFTDSRRVNGRVYSLSADHFEEGYNLLWFFLGYSWSLPFYRSRCWK